MPMTTFVRSLLIVGMLNGIFCAMGFYFAMDFEKIVFAVTLSVIFNFITVLISPGKDIIRALRDVPRSSLLLVSGIFAFVMLGSMFIPRKSGSVNMWEFILTFSIFLLALIAADRMNRRQR